MNNGKLQARDPAADILRCVAAFSVISVHFFMNSGFYSSPIDCPRMIVLLFMRSAFVVCVPLFLTLTGYLMTNKRLVRSYYRGIRNTLFTYVVSGLCCMLLFPVFYRWLQPVLGLPDKASEHPLPRDRQQTEKAGFASHAGRGRPGRRVLHVPPLV